MRNAMQQIQCCIIFGSRIQHKSEWNRAVMAERRSVSFLSLGLSVALLQMSAPHLS